jgi:hypothetical protein
LGHGALFRFDLGLKPFFSMRPAFGVVGQTISILGQGFNHASSVVFTPNAYASGNIYSDTYEDATVPTSALTGTVKQLLLPSGHTNADQKFRVLPVVLSFSPSSGVPGTQVVITGNTLTGATKVTFGGVKATTFSVNSYTQITATVPAKAKSGKIQVTTPGGAADSPTAFTVN